MCKKREKVGKRNRKAKEKESVVSVPLCHAEDPPSFIINLCFFFSSLSLSHTLTDREKVRDRGLTCSKISFICLYCGGDK